MRQKKGYVVMVLMMVAVFSMALVPSTAKATADISSARIATIGTIISSQEVKIVVTVADESDPQNFTGFRQYFLHPTLGKEGYAALLTAFSMEKNVFIRVESLDSLSLITIIYVNE